MLKLRSDALGGKIKAGNSTIQELTKRGFSSSIIEQFFRPFLGGVFLETALQSSTVSLQSVFRNFALGTAQLPVGGMGELSRSMAKPLIKSRILLGRRATTMTKNLVRLEDGAEIIAERVISALDVDSLRALRPDLPGLPKTHSVSNLYFSSPTAPPIGRFLVLNGTGKGAINNLVALSEICPGYAPKGMTLLSVSVLSGAASPESIALELENWFPKQRFTFLKSYTVTGALPEQFLPPPRFEELEISLCGDFLAPASIEGAVASGVQVAERLDL